MTYAYGVSAEGARVVIADVLDGSPVVGELAGSGGECLSVTTDVSNEASTLAMAQAAMDRFGRIDVLINNAAMFSETTRGPFTDVSIVVWDRTFEVNVRGAWLCIKAVYPHMVARGSGKIINIGSNTCFKGTLGIPHYVASKSALLGTDPVPGERTRSGPHNRQHSVTGPDSRSGCPSHRRHERPLGGRGTGFEENPGGRGHGRHDHLPQLRGIRLRDRPEPAGQRGRPLCLIPWT